MKSCVLERGCRLNRRYQIGKTMGQGGFGITYLAKDETLGQNVVIKEYFPAELASRDAKGALELPEEASGRKRFEDGMKRFLKEARIMASLSEVPGVVKVLDYFRENKTAYIVMEHVKGISLRAYLERTGEEISFERACQMLSPVMTALEKIHSRGLLHRDITPDNLMVEENGLVRLLDFGSARQYGPEEGGRTKTVLLKNGYAPPEQYDKKGHQGPWTDIYALCATIYEMMTGCIVPGALERQVKDELYAPSCYAAEITPEQEARFLTRGLALDYRKRYASVQELRADFFPEAQQEERKKKPWLRGLAFGLAAAAALFFFLKPQDAPESPVSAGNYDRGSQQYEEFLTFVKEHAVQTDRQSFADGTVQTDAPEDTAVYTLDEEAVRQLGVPANSYYMMKWKPQEILEILENAGYTLKSEGASQHFTVTQEPHGVLKSDFTVRDNYGLADGTQLVLCYDYNSERLTDIEIWENGEEGQAGMASLAADLLGTLLPDLPAEMQKSAADISEGIAEYRKQTESGALVCYIWELGDLNAELFQKTEAEKEVEVPESKTETEKEKGVPESKTGIRICRDAGNAPPYPW